MLKTMTMQGRGLFMAHDDRYREQTEEDLENIPPMGGVQKAVLAAAAVLLAVFVAYLAFS